MSLEIKDKLAELKKKYVQSLPDKFSDIYDLWLKACEVKEPDSLTEMYRMVHSLAGSGATFGQVELSKKAKDLELYLKENSDDISTKKFVDNINELLANLKVVVDYIGGIEHPVDEAPAFGLGEMLTNRKQLGSTASRIKILLADDDEDSRAQISTILRAIGHEVSEASNGQEVLECFAKNRPDLVLLDVVMPIMNGYSAAKIIKEQSAGLFIPIIFLTSITDNESLAECISAGGDDFLNKPVHPIILNAKIAAMQRIKETYKKLDEYQRKTEEELETTEHLFDSLIYCNHDKIKNLDSWSIFPGHFSGDLLLSAQLENGDSYMLLCDFTGHGLPAALGTVFVADLFQDLTKAQEPADLILEKINAKMHNILPVGRYCAAVMVAVNGRDGSVSLWNNGLPTAYLVDSDHHVIEQFPSDGLPLGILASINVKPAIFRPQVGCSLIFYSDGVTEAINARGEMYSERRLRTLITGMPTGVDLLAEIKQELLAYIGETELVDDLSIMVLTF